MAVLGPTLWAFFMVTVVASKPICLGVSEDSSKSSESSESRSSEERASHFAPTQVAVTETDKPNAVGETDPLNTALLPSSATTDTSSAPHSEDPQTSTDALQLIPDDPSQADLGGDFYADTVHVAPEASLHPDIIVSRTKTNITNTHHVNATPPPTPLSFSTATPLKIPIGNTEAPVSFTIQFTTPEAAPPRGDSI